MAPIWGHFAMNRLATCAAAVAALVIGTPAFAAPPPAPAPVYNWTGWYVGVNAGASFGSVKTDLNGAPIFADTAIVISPGFGIPNDKEYPDGFIGGGQIGYNWQYSPLVVVGLEADFQGSLEKAGANNLTQNFIFANPNVPNTGSIAAVAASYTTQIDWFGTVRGRIGYVWGNGEVLSYVTGGLAYGEVKTNGTTTFGDFAALNANLFLISNTQNFGQSHVNTGWVVGYGTEGHLPLMPGNWSWKIEGLYMDLGTLNTTGVTSSNVCLGACPPLSGGQVTTHSHFTDGILRAGLNYKFY
jgi:outer membrane immunogenic protein